MAGIDPERDVDVSAGPFPHLDLDLDLDAPPDARPAADPIGAQAYEAADMQGALQRSLLPAAVAVRYDGETDRVTVILDTGVELAFAPRLVQGLGSAEIDDLSEAEISPSGHGLHFPRLNADVYLPGLLEGVMGTRRWMAAMARATPLRVVPRDAPWEIKRP
ncbi:hypothetical protein CDN99_12875 [Roseateles aquatilis]|uniref:Uncharacterized protein n=1 Tax=Roseateles aquatilis TaxID=431061 RepID=A0A246JC69_9BURK|nr:DUF2442 domain-containing protein [Roseateles aquatilis]OWQ90262.1 hypothetical protein CDN99_12875 [Roseateles aquatilis]